MSGAVNTLIARLVMRWNQLKQWVASKRQPKEEPPQHD